MFSNNHYRENAYKFLREKNYELARLWFSKWTESLRQDNENSGGKLQGELEQAQKEYSDFVKNDPLYIKIFNTILPKLKEDSGILQTELYKLFPQFKKEDISYTLYFANEHNKIQRIKKSLTYSLPITEKECNITTTNNTLPLSSDFTLKEYNMNNEFELKETGKMTKLTCSSCGGKLELTDDIKRFACGYCGTEWVVNRGGGIVSLKVVEQRLDQIEYHSQNISNNTQNISQHTNVIVADIKSKKIKEKILELSNKRDKLQYKSNKSGCLCFLLPFAYQNDIKKLQQEINRLQKEENELAESILNDNCLLKASTNSLNDKKTCNSSNSGCLTIIFNIISLYFIDCQVKLIHFFM